MARKSGLALPEESRRKLKTESEHWWDRQHSLVLRQTPRWAQSMALGLVLLGIGGITASSIIKIDEVVTVTGTLKPSTGIYELKTPAGGLIQEVSIKEGEYINKGQIAVKFDTRKAEKDIKRLRERNKKLEDEYLSTKRVLETRRDSITKSLETNGQILKRMETLSAVGAIADNTLLQQKDKVYELESELTVSEEKIIQNKSAYDQQIKENNYAIEVNNIQKQYEEVKSPREGIAFDIKAVDKGVLGAGEVIMKIIPQKGLKGEITVSNRDIGYIKIGQKAQVRVDSFNYTQFGYIDAKIKSIGAELKPDAQKEGMYLFPVVLELEKNYLETKGIKIPLMSGMSITANLKLREKRLISVVSDLFNDNYDALTRLRQ